MLRVVSSVGMLPCFGANRINNAEKFEIYFIHARNRSQAQLVN